ncbi:MAG TPA: hypothetical protein VGM84_02105 [Steroidobacteraceae bacterium]
MSQGRLEPQMALAIANAIENEMIQSKLVTVPILDARMAAVDARFAALDARFTVLEKTVEVLIERTKAELVRWVFGTFLGSSVISAAGAVVTYVLTSHPH